MDITEEIREEVTMRGDSTESENSEKSKSNKKI